MIDLTNQKIGEWLVISQAESSIQKNGKPRKRWLCKCSCGTTKIVRQSDLRNGSSKSCGLCNTISGATKEYQKEHYAWCDMKARCNNPNHKRYKDYGARNITVCDQWQNSFKQFLKDVGLAPSKNHLLDRTNNNLGYIPSNVKWVDYSQSNHNRRINKNNKTGYKGVYFSNGKYKAKITKNKIEYYLGSFDTAEEAYNARLCKEKQLLNKKKKDQ